MSKLNKKHKMDIQEVREKFSDYVVSHLPKKDYLIGITDTKFKRRTQDLYDEVYVAEHSETNLFYLLYPNKHKNGWLTGSFDSELKAINWFKNGGR